MQAGFPLGEGTTCDMRCDCPELSLGLVWNRLPTSEKSPDRVGECRALSAPVGTGAAPPGTP